MCRACFSTLILYDDLLKAAPAALETGKEAGLVLLEPDPYTIASDKRSAINRDPGAGRQRFAR